MALDLLLAALCIGLAVLGALTGAARQLSQWLALIAAWFIAKTLGPALAPMFVKAMGQLGSLVAMTFVTFIVVMVLLRYLLKIIILRMFSQNEEQSRSVDRVLGFLLGATKGAVLTWVAISALAFVEDNVRLKGKGLGLLPADSQAFAFARRYNLFSMTIFSPVRDLSTVARASLDRTQRPGLAKDPAYAALLKDDRFRKVIANQALTQALANKEFLVLLRDPNVLSLTRDPRAARNLSAAAQASAR